MTSQNWVGASITIHIVNLSLFSLSAKKVLWRLRLDAAVEPPTQGSDHMISPTTARLVRSDQEQLWALGATIGSFMSCCSSWWTT